MTLTKWIVAANRAERQQRDPSTMLGVALSLSKGEVQLAGVPPPRERRFGVPGRSSTRFRTSEGRGPREI